MGGSNSVDQKVPEGDKKNIVIVGSSFGGRILTSMISQIDQKHTRVNVTLIDKSEVFEWICGDYITVAEPDQYGKGSVSMASIAAQFGTDAIKFKQAKLVGVNEAANTIDLTLPDGGSETMSYDALCLVTGASYVSPWRPEGDYAKATDRQAEFTQVNKQIQAAKTICCVGAGPTGIETAGYLKERYPDKDVSICLRGKTILPMYPKAHAVALKVLTKAGVNVLFEHPLKDGKVGDKEFDCILNCSGFKYNGPQEYMKGPLADCLCKKTGQIQVNSYCQVTDAHPLVKDTSGKPVKVYKNIFSYGDVCITPSNEVKQIVSLYQYGFQVASNLVEVATGGSAKVDIPANDQFHRVVAMPVGQKNGIILFNNMASEEPNAHRQKMELRDNMIQGLKGDMAAVQREMEGAKGFGKAFEIASGCCYCLPIHRSKYKSTSASNFEKSKQDYNNFYAKQ